MENSKVIKVMMLGDSGVGKSSILERYVNRNFTGTYKVTLGSNFYTVEKEIEQKRVLLQLWDTAGQEKYKSLSVLYYRGSEACIFVFDICNKESFENLDEWVKLFFYHISEEERDTFPIILLANKIDMVEKSVTDEEIEEWCRTNNNIKYYKTSAKTGSGLDDAFMYIATIAVQRAKEKEYFVS
eukprot:TRINITY_DN3612_c0_g1_i3.p2 TRINITY_DN3612_c0_g1~~TRINITY_DN3612_c0_g1_i3.p2  ORF type:complete len:216 (+),score=76.43 TRINITY_DN3612_c0_g1_i3:98-649(+)